MALRLQLPANGWVERPYQRRLWSYLQSGGQRAIEIAHRRWGKDDVMLHHTAIAAHERVASFWYCLPEFAQARKAIWTAVNAHTGKRRIDEAFPPELRESSNDNEMFIRFKNGSTWQVIGSDRFDNLVGAGVAGVVFSEWALANPSAWGYIRPMVEENEGWAAFITTPRGNNSAKSMYEMAKTDMAAGGRWFAELSSIRETGALTQEQLDEARSEYIALFGEDFGNAQFEQEYYCAFNAPMLGSYFGREMDRAEREGRMRTIEIDLKWPVHTVWDLGKAVNNPIICFQVRPTDPGPRVVDFYRPQSDDLEEWVKWLNDRGYKGNDYVPHDIVVQEWGTKRTRYETLKLLGRRPKRIAKVSVADGLQAARRTINNAVFHVDGTERGERMQLCIDGLKAYRREWDDELKTFRDNPLKDWAEHIGSAGRYLGLAWRDAVEPKIEKPKPKDLEYVAGPLGSIQGNMSVADAVDAMVRRRRNNE